MASKQPIRRYVRVRLPRGMLVAWEHSGARLISRVSVIAVGGLFIATPEPPPVGNVIRLVFEVPGGEVRARGMVRDCKPGAGMGIEFTNMRSEARAKLNRLMKTLSK